MRRKNLLHFYGNKLVECVDNFELNLFFLNSLIKKERFYFIGQLLHFEIKKSSFISTDQSLTKTEIIENAGK